MAICCIFLFISTLTMTPEEKRLIEYSLEFVKKVETGTSELERYLTVSINFRNMHSSTIRKVAKQ